MIKVLAADDHTIVRQGLKQILAETNDIAVAGEACNGPEVLHQLQEQEWDVLLMDISMPGTSGVDLLKRVRRERPNLPVLILTMYPEEQYAVRLLKAGANGYLTKESTPEQLVMAVRTVARGRKFISATVGELLASEIYRMGDSLPHLALSDREYQIFRILASGKTVSAIADELALSVKTVSTYRRRVLDKMGMKNNAELTRHALKNGLID